MRRDRRVILADTVNFPTDRYMASGLIETLGRDHALRLVEPEAVEAAIDDDVAVLQLTEVDYRTGRLNDMARLTTGLQVAGPLKVWEVAHHAGPLPVDLGRTSDLRGKSREGRVM